MFSVLIFSLLNIITKLKKSESQKGFEELLKNKKKGQRKKGLGKENASASML